MTHDEVIRTYLRAVRSSLHLPRQQRRRVLEELESHLRDGAAEHAIATVIDELGPPDVVAAGFNQAVTVVPDSAGISRWLPLVAPALLLAITGGLLVWSLTWVRDGWTVGERQAQRAYLVAALVPAVLSYAAYVAIRWARRDRAWRWAAWLCTVCAVLIVVTPRLY